MSTIVSLTELRQRLFKLADHVAETGEPLVILRNGVRLRLVRDETAEDGGRLSRLVPQTAVVGAPLAPDESPAVWSTEPGLKAAESSASYRVPARPKGGRRS